MRKTIFIFSLLLAGCGTTMSEATKDGHRVTHHGPWSQSASVKSHNPYTDQFLAKEALKLCPGGYTVGDRSVKIEDDHIYYIWDIVCL